MAGVDRGVEVVHPLALEEQQVTADEHDLAVAQLYGQEPGRRSSWMDSAPWTW